MILDARFHCGPSHRESDPESVRLWFEIDHGPAVDKKHISTYYVFMKNVTLAIDESLLREARKIAADRSTTLNAMIREFLQDLAERESKAKAARRRIIELCRSTQGEVGPRDWSRGELHER